MGSDRPLTELEGAVLTEIACRGNDTVYKVRRAFQESPSPHWQGSAEGVAPAVKRLTKAGYITTEEHGRLQGLRLSITDIGASVLQAWAANLEAACGLGMDPFRLRSGLWLTLPTPRRRALLRTLEEMLEEEVRTLEKRAEGDSIDRIQTELAVALQVSRLYWVRRLLAGL